MVNGRYVTELIFDIDLVIQAPGVANTGLLDTNIYKGGFTLFSLCDAHQVKTNYYQMSTTS